MSDIPDLFGWRSVHLDEPPEEEMVLIYDWQHEEISILVDLVNFRQKQGRFDIKYLGGLV